ncbi:MAG: hypothetical protein AAGF85_16440 [Bacteroidota bacterium]
MKNNSKVDFDRIKLLLITLQVNVDNVTSKSEFKRDLNMNDQLQAKFFHGIESYTSSFFMGFRGIKSIDQLLKRMEDVRYIESQF